MRTHLYAHFAIHSCTCTTQTFERKRYSTPTLTHIDIDIHLLAGVLNASCECFSYLARFFFFLFGRSFVPTMVFSWCCCRCGFILILLFIWMKWRRRAHKYLLDCTFLVLQKYAYIFKRFIYIRNICSHPHFLSLWRSFLLSAWKRVRVSFSVFFFVTYRLIKYNIMRVYHIQLQQCIVKDGMRERESESAGPKSAEEME